MLSLKQMKSEEDGFKRTSRARDSRVCHSALHSRVFLFVFSCLPCILRECVFTLDFVQLNCVSSLTREEDFSQKWRQDSSQNWKPGVGRDSKTGEMESIMKKEDIQWSLHFVNTWRPFWRSEAALEQLQDWHPRVWNIRHHGGRRHDVVSPKSIRGDLRVCLSCKTWYRFRMSSPIEEWTDFLPLRVTFDSVESRLLLAQDVLPRMSRLVFLSCSRDHQMLLEMAVNYFWNYFNDCFIIIL